MRFAVPLFALVALSACGGRVGEDVFDEVDGATTDDSGVTVTDSGTIIVTDSGTIIVTDTGTSLITDTGLVPVDTGVPPPPLDTGVAIDTSVPPPVDTGVVDTGPVIVDVGPPVDAGGLTIAAACDKIAAATCSSAFQSCCTSSGYKWDALGCSDVSHLWCKNGANGVATGKTTYDPSWAEACANGWAIATSLCQPHLFDWVKAQMPCSQMFNGSVAPGGVCNYASDCKAGAGQTAWCDDGSKRCRAISISSLGQPCNYFGATIRWCDKGLTCDTSSSGVSSCIKATPVGGSCFGPDDTACGIGFSCKGGKCAEGSPPGVSCTRDLECASWSCSAGKCTDLRQQIASKAFCGAG